MRGEDLLEQRRSRARQADDEDGIGLRRSPPLTSGKELRGTDLDLLSRIVLYDLGAIPDLGVLEAVTQLIEMKGLGELTLVLECLAERKAKVIAIEGPRGRRLQRRAYLRE